ncbi:restriction endonuclease subunit S [Streptococcus suis]|uniref:restriction endonuclease subunit S n=1 Tax=Streptococcus suis TaxID=1307 RepID=UPI000CF50330|nr:restriction endonuclease subunit S [Streptococcus suis]
MTKEKSTVPRLRFPGFTDAWKQRKLGEVAEMYSGGTPSVGRKDYYTGGIPFIRSAEINSDTTELYLTELGLNNSSAKMVSKGSLLYALYGATSGEVGLSRLDGAINQAILAILPNDDLTTEFLMYWLRREKSTIVEKYLQGGQGNLSAGIVKQLEPTIPTLPEQEAIGNFFSDLDQLITLHQRKLDDVKELKKALLQKMFPKGNGNDFPELRFPEFTDAWKQRKLGEVAISFDYGLNSAATEYDGENKYLRITDIDDDSREFNISDLTSPEINLFGLDEYRLSIGDILFARTGASVGKSYIYRSVDGKVYFAGFLIRVKIKDTFNPDFVFQNTLTSNYERFISITSMRSGQPGVNAQEYSNYKIMFPTLPEQEVIGSFFSDLDQLITLHQRQLDHLKLLKKALLQQMFI